MPYDYLTTTGVIVPDTSTLKSDVQAEYTDQFGDDLLLEDETPQGRLIDVETTARSGVVGLTAQTANQINPNVAAGIFLKDICALHGVSADPDAATLLDGVVLSGTPKTIIPSGSRIADADNNYYALVAQVTLGADGTATGSFQATVYGALDPAANTVVTIVDGLFGWVSVTNPNAPTTVGSFSTTDAELRLKRLAMLSQMGKGPVEAINANVLAASGVRWLTSRDNPSSTGATIDGVVLPPSATWICVQGGVDADIGQAILASKQTGSPLTPGSGNGTAVNLSVVNTTSGQTYPVIFTRPDELRLTARVTVNSGSAIDPSTAVPDAFLAYANGDLDGERGFVVGASISPFECAAALNTQLPDLFFRKVELAIFGDSFSTEDITVELWQYCSLAAGDVAVVVV